MSPRRLGLAFVVAALAALCGSGAEAEEAPLKIGLIGGYSGSNVLDGQEMDAATPSPAASWSSCAATRRVRRPTWCGASSRS
jgi:hypothetical protein